jgi:hypothetical protein
MYIAKDVAVYIVFGAKWVFVRNVARDVNLIISKMAYNKRNLYKRIIEVQEITLRNNARGIPQTHTYRTEIEPMYHISYSCFCNWLGVPAATLLKQFDEREKQADYPKLFDFDE